MVVHLERVDEAPSSLRTILQFEADQPAMPTHQIGVRAASLHGVGMHAGIDDPRHLGPTREMARHGLGIAAMLAHAQRQGLEALDELEGVERAHRGTQVAQQGDAGFEDVGDGPEGLGRFRPYGAVIAGVGLIEEREAFRMPPPIEVAAIDDEAADRGSVAPDVLGRGINDDGGAVLQRPAQHGRRGIVHD